MFLPHDNAPAHRSVLVKGFLAKNNVATLEHFPFSPRLARADFYLFPQMKSALKGRRFCDVGDIIKNSTAELKSFHKLASRNVSTPLESQAELYSCIKADLHIPCHAHAMPMPCPCRAHGTRSGEGSASRPGRSLPQGKIQYPLYRRLGGPQGRSEQVRKISPPTGIRSPNRPVRSQSLYRLSYPKSGSSLY